jgi:hypothetical protein
VGHSFAGMVVTEAGIDPKVSAVVYVAARAPDAGEDYTALAKRFPTPPASAGSVFDGDEGRLTEAALLHAFAGDLPEAKGVLCGPRAVLQAAVERQDPARLLALEAELLCGFDGRSDDQSRSRAIHEITGLILRAAGRR